MKTAIIAAAVATLFAVPVFAVENAPQQRAAGPNFEQHKAEIIKRIDQRIANNQEEKACVQAATDHKAVKACQEKFKGEMREMRQRK